MKNPKKLTRQEKMFLQKQGYEAEYYLMVKKTTECYTVYNTETKQVHDIWR